MLLPKWNEFSEVFNDFHKRPRTKGRCKVADFIKAVYSRMYLDHSNGQSINIFSELLKEFLVALSNESHDIHPRQTDSISYLKNPNAYNLTIDKIQACLTLAFLCAKNKFIKDDIGIPLILENYEPALMPLKNRSYKILIAANNSCLLFFGDGDNFVTYESMDNAIDKSNWFYNDYSKSLLKLKQIFNNPFQDDSIDNSNRIYNLSIYIKEIISGTVTKSIQSKMPELPWLLLTTENIINYHKQFISNSLNNSDSIDWIEFTHFIIAQCDAIQKNIINFMHHIFRLTANTCSSDADVNLTKNQRLQLKL